MCFRRSRRFQRVRCFWRIRCFRCFWCFQCYRCFRWIQYSRWFCAFCLKLGSWPAELQEAVQSAGYFANSGSEFRISEQDVEISAKPVSVSGGRTSQHDHRNKPGYLTDNLVAVSVSATFGARQLCGSGAKAKVIFYTLNNSNLSRQYQDDLTHQLSRRKTSDALFGSSSSSAPDFVIFPYADNLNEHWSAILLCNPGSLTQPCKDKPAAMVHCDSKAGYHMLAGKISVLWTSLVGAAGNRVSGASTKHGSSYRYLGGTRGGSYQEDDESCGLFIALLAISLSGFRPLVAADLQGAQGDLLLRGEFHAQLTEMMTQVNAGTLRSLLVALVVVKHRLATRGQSVSSVTRSATAPVYLVRACARSRRKPAPLPIRSPRSRLPSAVSPRVCIMPPLHTERRPLFRTCLMARCH